MEPQNHWFGLWKTVFEGAIQPQVPCWFSGVYIYLEPIFGPPFLIEKESVNVTP